MLPYRTPIRCTDSKCFESDRRGQKRKCVSKRVSPGIGIDGEGTVERENSHGIRLRHDLVEVANQDRDSISQSIHKQCKVKLGSHRSRGFLQEQRSIEKLDPRFLIKDKR